MDLMERIWTLIRSQGEGDCPPPAELARLYRERRVGQVPFEHVLCCATCLDVINDALGLPRLNERHPFDLARQSAHSKPSSSGPGNAGGRNHRDQAR